MRLPFTLSPLMGHCPSSSAISRTFSASYPAKRHGWESKRGVAQVPRNEFYEFLKVCSRPAVEEAPELREEAPRDEETVLAVRSAVSHLPEEQRRAIQAVYFEGQTYEEAAEATGIPLGSLKRYLRLGLGQLRAH